MPSSGMLTECVSLAEKSKSNTVLPPFPSVTVRRGVPEAEKLESDEYEQALRQQSLSRSDVLILRLN